MISNIGEGATPLMYACQQCREREVLDIISRKRNSVRERDRTLKTPLHYCTENPTTGCAEAVLRAAPDLLDARDEDGYTALHLAVIAGNKTFLRFLISRGANVNALDNERHSAVHWATVCGEEEALEIILRAGANLSTADIHGGYPLHYAAQMCGPGGEMGRGPKIGLRILNILLSHDIDINVKDKDGRQPILWAASADAQSRDPGARFASSGSADAILALVKAGASVEESDKDGLTALHCAASRGHTDCIETLVSLCGAHIDVIDSNGCTALFYAVTLGHADASQLLLSLGAEPNRQDRKGRTPAHCGAAKGQLETLRILQNYGANLWLRNVKGDFPLHEAVASGRRELVRWLLSQRLDSINVGNNDGRCPIHIAAINNNVDMIKILLDSQSLVNPIMRTTKGTLMTPLDAALHRGFRGCAKYLQLHGGVPFSKLTEKSSNIKGTTSRQITSDMYTENYGDRLGAPQWVVHQSSVPSFVPTQIRMGGDNAIQQIETSHLRLISRIPDDYDIVRSSDEEKIFRRRRRRRKWVQQRKGNISEEDSNDDEPPEKEFPKRRQRTGIQDGNLMKERGEYDESSSDEYYKRKVVKKKDYVSDEEGRRRFYSNTENSEGERKQGRKLQSRKNNSQKSLAQSDHSTVEKSDLQEENFSQNKVEAEEPVYQSVVAEVHINPTDDPAEALATETIPVEVEKKNEENDENDGKMIETEALQTIPEVVSPTDHVTSDNSVKVQSENNEKTVGEAADREESEVVEPLIEVEENVPLESSRETEGEVSNENNVSNIDNQKEEETNTGEEAQNEVDIVVEKGEDEREAEAYKSDDEILEEEEKNENSGKTEESEVDPVLEAMEGEESKGEELNTQTVIEDQEEQIQELDEIGGEMDLEKSYENEVLLTEEIPNEEDEVEEKGGDVEDVEEDEEEEEEGKDEEVVQEEEQEDQEEQEEEVTEAVNERNDFVESAFEVLDNAPNSAIPGMIPYSRSNSRKSLSDGNSSRRGSEFGGKEYRSVDAEGSIGDESGGSTKNEDSSALMDSGIEPSPRRKLTDSNQRRDGQNSGSVKTRISRLCNKGQEPEEIHTVSVTQTVQNTIRKYHMERKIFYQLLELKRLQIRAGRANEQVLVKRLVEEYRRDGIIPGLKNYSGKYTFRQFEKFLYDQLRTLQSTARFLIPKLRPSDDIETLSTILRKSRVELVDDVPENPMFCTLGTHRCHHAAHAYTGIPCAAYITKLNHHEMPKTKTTGFLPNIDQAYTEKGKGQQVSYRPVTLEVSHGKEKQVISLPTDRLDKNKRYYVTFTIKGAPPLDEGKSDHEERMLRHRHAKSF